MDEESYIPPEDRIFVKTELDKFHEFLGILGVDLATTNLNPKEVHIIRSSGTEAFHVYELTKALFYKAFSDAPDEVFEGEEINPLEFENKEKGVKVLAKYYAFKTAMNLMVGPIILAFANKSKRGFIPKLLRGGVSEPVEQEPESPEGSFISKLRP